MRARLKVPASWSLAKADGTPLKEDETLKASGVDEGDKIIAESPLLNLTFMRDGVPEQVKAKDHETFGSMRARLNIPKDWAITTADDHPLSDGRTCKKAGIVDGAEILLVPPPPEKLILTLMRNGHAEPFHALPSETLGELRARLKIPDDWVMTKPDGTELNNDDTLEACGFENGGSLLAKPTDINLTLLRDGKSEPMAAKPHETIGEMRARLNIPADWLITTDDGWTSELLDSSTIQECGLEEGEELSANPPPPPPYTLTFSCMKAEGVPDKDDKRGSGVSDPFVKITLEELRGDGDGRKSIMGEISGRTHWIQNARDPEWKGQTIVLQVPGETPRPPTVLIEIWDKDWDKSDDFVCSKNFVLDMSGEGTEAEFQLDGTNHSGEPTLPIWFTYKSTGGPFPNA